MGLSVGPDGYGGGVGIGVGGENGIRSRWGLLET